MIFVYAGKKYNTETAEKIGSHIADGARTCSLQHLLYTLYKKRTGEFFLVMSDDPDLDKASLKQCRPIGRPEAACWARKNLLDTDFYDCFLAPFEQTEPVRITIQLPAVLAAKVREEAGDCDISVSKMVEHILKQRYKN